MSNASMNDSNPYGDDGGTRVGKPNTPDRDNTGGNGDDTDSGNEAARGLHEQNPAGKKDTNRPGSEPLTDRGTEHKSGYGGEGGAPRTSSNER